MRPNGAGAFVILSGQDDLGRTVGNIIHLSQFPCLANQAVETVILFGCLPTKETDLNASQKRLSYALYGL